MSDRNQVVIQKSEYWMRVGLAINHTVKDILLCILHNSFNDPSYTGLPTDPQKLYTALDGIRKRGIIPSNVLGKNQWVIILPLHPANSAGCSNSKDFDITMIIVLLRNGTDITPPLCGWTSILDPSDTSVAAFSIIAKELRNDFSHNRLPIIMSLVQFQDAYHRIERITCGMCSFDNLRYKQYEDQLHEFKNGSLHPHMTSILDNVQKKVIEIDQSKVDTTTFKAAKEYLNILINDLKICIEKETKTMDDFKAKVEKEKEANDHRSYCLEHNVQELLRKIDQEFLKDFDKINNEVGIIRENALLTDLKLEELDEQTTKKFKYANDKLEILEVRTNETNFKLEDTNQRLDETSERLKATNEKLETLQGMNDELDCKLKDTNDKQQEERDDKHLILSTEVLNLVASNIGEDWKCLADNLDLKCSILYQLKRSNEKKMLHCFQKRNIIWHELKKSLEILERHDIINMICDSFKLPSDDIHTTNYLHCKVRSHGSAEISEVNQQHQLKLLKEHDIITYISCGEKHTMTLKDWDKKCKEYFQRYYEPQEKLLFPPPKGENMFHEELTKKLLSYLDPEEGNICLFSGYDILNHIRLHIGCSKTYKQILKDLLISSDKELQNSKNRFLLFNIKHKLILNIRITESADISAISKEERTGRSDLKLLLFLNQRFIKATGITLTNVVLSPNIRINDSSVCCKDCIVLDQLVLNADKDNDKDKDKDKYDDKENFRKWWRRNIFPRTEWKDKICDATLFTGIISTIFGFMGTKQVNMKHWYFPKFRRDDTLGGDEHTEIINLMLTYDQSRVVDHPALKKIVFGGFGAGKSLIGQCKLQELGKQEANTTNHTFYICGDDRSILQLHMKSMVEEIKKAIPNQNFHSYNLRELAEVYLKLPKIPSISELLNKINLKCCGTAHLIIDEFNLETLDNNQVTSLNKIFKNDEWKPSVVLLLPQSLEKEHTIIADGKEDSKSENTAYECIDDMECFTLSKHMRSTKSNFEFQRMSAKIISTLVTNSINHPSLHSESKTSTVGILFDDNASRKEDETTIEDAADGKSASRIESIKESVQDKRPDDSLFQEPVNSDELQVYKSDYPNRTDTVYSPRKCDDIGHGIDGKKPKFIYFDHINTEAEACAKLFLILQKLFSSDCERLWLCKFQKDFRYCFKLLELFKNNYINYHPLSGYRLVDGKGNLLEEIPVGFDIITDNKGARGLEYQQVVVFIPSGNSNQQQTFLETVSRCTSELFIICLDPFDINHQQKMPPVIHQILSEAIHQNIIQECVICNCEIDDTDIVVIHTSNNGKDYYKVNRNSRKYKELYSHVNSLDPVHTYAEENKVSPFDAPTGLKCMIKNENGNGYSAKKYCELRWNQSPFDFIVTKKHTNADHVEFTSKPTSSSSYKFEDMIIGEDYILSVSTYSSFGESIPTQLPWRHVDLFDVIGYNDSKTLNTTIDMFPWRLNDEDTNGRTLYHYAAYNKSSILEYMLHVDKTNINKVDRWNRTPLFHASEHGYIDCVDLLLSHGANCSVMDVNKKTAYDVVCEGYRADQSNKEKIQKMLLNKMKK